jgi:Family of unknown function (DUF5995)
VQANDPPFVGWSAIMPPLVYKYNPNSANDCVAGRVACVKKTIATMQKRFDPLAASCSHHAVFALAYLRTTQAYLEYTQMPGFFDDAPFVNHEDAAFAQMYFNAFDDWKAGRVTRVPPAWRIALQAADGKQVSGAGDLLLGMNAHVNRDLPFVLYAIGLTTPTGASRKHDHDQVNIILNHVIQPLLEEEAARFDPDMATMPTPYGVGYSGLLQTLVAWREAAWRNAEQLTAAPTAAARDQVAQQIEDYAATTARGIVTSTAYHPPVTTTAARDQYCAAHGTSGG